MMSLRKTAAGLVDVDLRWIYLHMIEEYARHCGHADLCANSSTARPATRTQSSSLKGRHEGLLGDFDASEVLHALLALFLLLEEFALARDVTAVTLGEHVLATGLHGLASDDASADRPPGSARRTSGAG